MSNYDFAVKTADGVQRLISNGEQAALFSKAGLITKRLTIVQAPVGAGLPGVVDEDGEAFALTKTGRPCSCIGGVWRQRASELAAAL